MSTSTPEPPPLPPSLPPPLATVLEFRKAGFWRRVAAFLIDVVILAVVGWILGFMFADAFIRMGGWERLIGFGVAALYFVPLNGPLGCGQTVGKKALGIRVVSRTGTELGLAKSFVRSLVLMLPYFLNGAPIPLKVVNSAGGFLFAVAVFGLGLSILYLIAFNARTRQSLHDLPVGSYVVRAGSEASDKPQTWAGHHIVVGAILVATVVVPLILGKVFENWLPKELMTAYEAIQDEPEVTAAQVFAGQSVFWDSTKGQSAVTTVTVTVRLNRKLEDREAEANKIVRILLEKYPDAASKDSIAVTLNEGYDLGIAAWFRGYRFINSPAQWRQRLGETTPAR